MNTTRNVKVLCVDSDPEIRQLLKRNLEHYGYSVDIASNSQEALLLIAEHTPQLLFLEYTLKATRPISLDAISFCRDLRTWNMVPIIVISEYCEPKYQAAALNAGADDYIIKPFAIEALEARMRAVLRRSMPEELRLPKGEIHIKDMVIDLTRHRISLQGREVHLSPKEYELVCVLAANAGKVLTHRTLLDKVWREKSSKSEHYLRVYVNNIRKKLTAGSVTNSDYIITEPGIGYRFMDG